MIKYCCDKVSVWFIFWRDQKSVVNCCIIIGHSPVFQNLFDSTPPYWVSHQCKSNSFPVCLERIFLVFNMSCSYQNKPNSFCYICSEVVWKSQRKPLSKLVRKAYELYFGCKIGDQDKVWAPKISLFKAKISQNKWGQEETRNFYWSTNCTNILRPRL